MSRNLDFEEDINKIESKINELDTKSDNYDNEKKY